MKKFLIPVLIALMIVFCILPFPSADLTVRIVFENLEDNIKEDESFLAYYGVEEAPEFAQERRVYREFIPDTDTAKLYFDRYLAKSIVNFRIDMPVSDTPYIIKKVVVSSAGIPVKTYEATDFFAGERLAYANDISSMEVLGDGRLSMLADGNDPFVMFTGDTISEMKSCISNYRITRFGICILVLLTIICYRRKIFD